MALTVLTQIVEQLDLILKAHVPPGTQVFRDRADAESRQESPCVNVVVLDDETESFSAEMDKHSVMAELEFNVRAEPATPAVELVHQAVHRFIVTDSLLLTLCESVRLAPSSFALEPADLTSQRKTVRYRFTYLIPQTTL